MSIVSLKALSKSPITTAMVVIGALSFVAYSSLAHPTKETGARDFAAGALYTAFAILLVWSFAKYWQWGYQQMTEYRSKTFGRIVQYCYGFMAVLSILFSLLLTLFQWLRDGISPASGLFVLGALLWVFAWLLIQTWAGLSLLMLLVFGLFVLRGRCVDFCRRRGTTEYPRVRTRA